MNTLFFCLALGGASLILLIGGLRLIRKYPRVSRSEIKAIRRGLAHVEAGRTKPLEQVRAEMRERERIRAGQLCSDKNHWH